MQQESTHGERIFPKIIWMYWESGWQTVPAVVKECRASWEHYNPNWDIRLLDDRTVTDYFDVREEISDFDRKNIRIQHKADIIRANLLSSYGGVWADATLWCHKPLDAWLYDHLVSGFFAFSNPGKDRIIANWFLAGHVNGYIIGRLKETIRNYWRTQTSDDCLFWFHFLFKMLYMHDSKTRTLWDAVPKIDCPQAEPGPHYFSPYQSPQLMDTSDEYKRMIASHSTPVYKLAHALKLEKYRAINHLFDTLKTNTRTTSQNFHACIDGVGNSPFTETAFTGHNLVFVVGSPRSGTTWIQRLLVSHPRIKTGTESDLFDMFIGPQLRAWDELLEYSTVKGGRLVGLPGYMEAEAFKSALTSYLRMLMKPMLADLEPHELFVEKTPGHALWIAEVVAMLPSCRFIHIIRDPRDVVASMMAASGSWSNLPGDARSAVEIWMQHIKSAMHHGRRLPKRQYLEIRYEDMLNDPIEGLSTLRDYLGIDWAHKDIVVAVEQNSFDNAQKQGGAGIPIQGALSHQFGGFATEPKGFFRKGRVGAWREDLSSNDLKIIYEVAGSAMRWLGYTNSNDASTL